MMKHKRVEIMRIDLNVDHVLMSQFIVNFLCFYAFIFQYDKRQNKNLRTLNLNGA